MQFLASQRRPGGTLWPSALLVAAIVLCYYQTAWYGFVDWDDNVYIANHGPHSKSNVHVVTGLSWDNVVWAFTTGTLSNWHPVTWLSFMLDCQLFGLNPGLMHLENVLLHAANSLLLYQLLRRMTGADGRSLMVAFLFAVHPLRVESVAWISERKDVLSTLFWLLTMLAYRRDVQRSGLAQYMLALLLFGLGLMAKPMLVTLPAVLLLVDYWPLNRFSSASILRLLREKIPFFALSVASSVITIYSPHLEGTLKSLEEVPLAIRLSNATVSYMTYLKLMLWPVDLACLYPYSVHPSSSLEARNAFLFWFAASSMALLLMTLACMLLRRRKPYLFVGWFWYLATLFPVIGVLQLGAQAMADRFSYVPLIGIFMALTWLVADALSEKPKTAFALGAALVMVCMPLTWKQVGYWKDTPTLFLHAGRVTRDNSVAETVLGRYYKRYGQQDLSRYHFQRACELRPDLYYTHLDYGIALQEFGDYSGARREFEKVLELEPGVAVAHAHLGVVLVQLHDDAGAERHFQIVLRDDPQDIVALNNLAFLRAKQGRPSEAATLLQTAVEAAPADLELRKSLVEMLMILGDRPRAAQELEEILRRWPDDLQASRQLQTLRGQAQ